MRVGAWVSGLLLAPLAGATGLPVGLKADGMPPPERWLAQPLREAEPERDTGDREVSPLARFAAWHPLRPEMLVLARRGGSVQLHRLRAPGEKPEPLTRGSERVTAAAYEPLQGRYIVFAQDQGGDEAFRLFRLDLDAEGQPSPGRPQLLTPGASRVSDWAFLPDGQGLVLVRQRLNRDAGAAAASHSSLVWLDPMKPDAPRELAALDGGRYTSLRVSRSGQILVRASRAGREQWWHFASAQASGRALGTSRAAEDEAPATMADRAHPASEAADTAPSGSPGESIWLRQTLGGEFRQLARLDLKTGRLSAPLRGLEPPADLEASAEQAGAGSESGWLALLHNEDGFSTLRLWRPGSGVAPQPVPGLEGSVLSSPAWHPRLPLLAVQQVSARSGGRIVVWDAAKQQLQAWAGSEQGGEVPQWQRLVWRSFDGRAISGLHLPPAARFEGPRPVYINLHGGPSAQARPGPVAGLTRQLSEQWGVHVIEPNVRGSDGFGRSFLMLDNGLRREDAVKDVSALLDWIATQPGMDASRVIVGGGSYGGYLSLAVAVHESARIAGSICRVGIAHFVSFLQNTESYRRDNRRAEYGDERDPAMREFLHRISPLTQAARITKPLLVVHGRNDPRVPYGEAEAIVRAVRAQGTPVWFLTGEDEGHGFRKAENVRFQNQAVLGFMQRVLAGWPADEAVGQPAK
ncbi:MAG: S9 family peptidase [Burkholderiales bacterium]|nr:S9 family peptidase [Burkholderiales bacterium]